MTALFGGSKPTQTAPKPPAPMPDDQSPAVLAAKRKKLAEMASSSGRASTILTAPPGGSPLGADSTLAGGASDSLG